MATATKKCLCCKDRKRNEDMKQAPNKQWFCDASCMANYANKKYQKVKRVKLFHEKADENKKVRAQKVEHKEKKKELITRSGWYQKLQVVVNRYVTKVRDKDKACCTCSVCGDHLKYDAGHYLAVGHNMDLRFELTNIHLQCSVKCNQFGRGMPVEYGEFIKAIYGEGYYNWLHTNFLCHKPHPTLKEQFPTLQDIELEIKRYRKLLKDAGV